MHALFTTRQDGSAGAVVVVETLVVVVAADVVLLAVVVIGAAVRVVTVAVVLLLRQMSQTTVVLSGIPSVRILAAFRKHVPFGLVVFKFARFSAKDSSGEAIQLAVQSDDPLILINQKRT